MEDHYSSGQQTESVSNLSLIHIFVVSVHSVVSFDFAVTQVPGWHQSIFPPYFVGGAILSGMAMVQLILLGVRRLMAGSGAVSYTHLRLSVNTSFRKESASSLLMQTATPFPAARPSTFSTVG